MKHPTVTELAEYAEHLGFATFDPQAFLDHYEANGWMVGRVKMKDWKATVRTWKRREPEFRPRSKQPSVPINLRNERINKLNQRKAQLMRMEQTKMVKIELERIRTELHKL